MAKNRNPDIELLSKQLSDLRIRTIRTLQPEDLHPPDDREIAVELNNWRQFLARIASVHNGGGRVRGWGVLELPALPEPVRLSSKDLMGDGEEEPDEGADEPQQTGSRRRSSRGVT